MRLLLRLWSLSNERAQRFFGVSVDLDALVARRGTVWLGLALACHVDLMLRVSGMATDIASSEPVVAIRTKLAHARHHLEQLDAEIGRWHDRHPYTVREKAKLTPKEWVYAIHLTEPIPVAWAVTVGEAVHDLRSALENVVYQLTIDKKGAPRSGTSFPIADGVDTPFRESNIKHLGDEAKAFIRSVQPTTGGECGRNLWALQKMWNQDKHQLAQLFRLQLGDDQTGLTIDPTPTKIVYADRLLDHGAEIFRVKWATAPAQVHVKGYLPVAIATDIPKAVGADGDTLWAMHDWAVSVASTLLGMLGRQDVAPW